MYDFSPHALRTVKNVRRQGVLVLAVSVSAAVLCARPANADDAQIQKLEAEIQKIEARHQAEISSLRAEIRQLRKQGPAAVAVVGTNGFAPGQPRPPGEPLPQLPPKILMTYDRGYHFGFSDQTGSNTIELFGRLHIDTGGYVGYKPGRNTLDQTGLASGIDLRRARIGVVGKFMGDWHYALIYDFGNTSDGTNPNNALANLNSSTAPSTNNNYLAGVENAFITYNGFYNHGGPFPVAIDLPGVQDVPWTLEESTSSNDIMFMERSSAQVVATEFGGGDFRTAAGAHSNNSRYWIGAYVTGPNSGALHTDGASCNSGTTSPTAGTPCIESSSISGLGPQLSGLFRASYQLWQTPDASLHLGFNYANLFDPRIGSNIEGVQLYDRPELRVDPTYFLNAGNIPAHGGEVFGGEAAAAWQNFFVQGEYYHYIVDTLVGTTAYSSTTAGVSGWTGGTPGPELNFNGGYVEASYSFGGKRLYNPATGAYTGVIPEHPLQFGTPGWGAIEIAGRYSTVNLNDPNLSTAVLGSAYKVPGTNGSTSGYGGSSQTSYGAGINWYPNLNMKFMLDYEHVVVDNPAYYGGPNTRGATIDWIAGRSQFIF
jgi:phosphate-selective porin OprO/OprP